MKNERSDLLFLLICFALCAALTLGMLFSGPSAARANEVLASAPALRSGERWNTRVLSDLSDWLSDRFCLRQELITAHNRLLAALGGGAAADVIAGRDGWLYYAPTLDDYTGAGALSDAELAAAARNLFLMQEYCAGRGARFLFVPAPNKNSLYDAAMPSYGVKAQEHSAQRLLRLLDAQGVANADLFAAFAARDEVLYFAHDSHWNARGAALAADEINARLGRQSACFAADFSARTPHAGDLFEMRYPAARDDETDCVFGGALDYVREGKDTRPDSITINTSSSGGDGTLLMFRDSFGNALYPYLADSFAAARFSRATAYNLTLAEKLGADTVVVELVERNLRYLLRFTPVMPAPERTLTEPGTFAGTVALTCPEATPALNGYTLYRGTLPEAAVGAPVCLCCGAAAYEAFTGGDGAFSCYLPAELSPDFAAVRVGDALCMYQTINP